MNIENSIEYLDRKTPIAAFHIDGLFDSVGWKKRGKEKWEEVLEKSSLVITAWDGPRLIGMGRMIEDGIMCMIYDVAVHPDYQSRGIGTQIMQKIVDSVKDKGYASIGLYIWENNPRAEEFYKIFGFEKVDTGMELVRHMQRE